MVSPSKAWIAIETDQAFRDELLQYMAQSKATGLPVAAGALPDRPAPAIAVSRDLVLFDASLLGPQSTDVALELMGAFPDASVVVIKGKGESKSEDLVTRLLRGGAIGAIDRRDAGRRLKIWIERRAAQATATRMRQRHSSDMAVAMLATLSVRERQILEDVVAGYRSREIGERLGIRSRTVDIHRQSVLQKLRARGTADLVKFAIRAGLISV